MEQHLEVPNIEQKTAAWQRALGVMQTLRKDCPWDAKQTNESIRQNSIEEMYELAEALIKGDPDEIKKECGDVMEQLFFYTMFAEEAGQFDMADMLNAMCDKLVFRHPHVFNPDGSLISQVGARGGENVQNADDVSKLWEVVKQKEKGGNRTILSGIPASLPSLIKAYRMQDKARNAGFDWEKREEVWAKVKEEISEFEAEVASMDKERMESEFGDLLFSLINAARLYKIKPDNALEKTNQKFQRRFTYVEEKAKQQGHMLNEMTLAEMDALWDEAKSKGL
ncbi:MAG: nucleoside triphosphate pyrophosphohydrolase [Bacteroidales bacterium]|jgi:XTP/dITP diphosphohydrolase|nr:nucleoside triphosphate pyrophosphohydrolase [Bacteroidales bacterium]